LSTEEIVAEFHEFVRPTESPELSDFCKKLTHLEKKDLSKEKTLEEVMIDFELWTKDVQKEHDLYFYTPKGTFLLLFIFIFDISCERKQRFIEKNRLHLHLDRLGHFQPAFGGIKTEENRNSRNFKILGRLARRFSRLSAIRQQENGTYSGFEKTFQSFEDGMGRKTSFGNR
jgi:hypothetical protein